MKRLVLAFTAALSWPSRGLAEPPPAAPSAVTLATARCDRSELDFPAFSRLLQIELRADGVGALRVEDRPKGRDVGLARITIEGACTADPVVVIDDAATDKSVRRALSLGDTPAAARPRALALATAELLRASWAELVLPAAPPPRVEVPTVVRQVAEARVTQAVIAAPARPPDPRHPRSWAIAVGADGRFFFGGRSGMIGARGGASAPIVGPLRLRGEIGAWAGGRADPLGSVNFTLVTGAIGLGVIVGSWPRARIELGPEVELGWARASGSADLATTAALQGSTWASLGSLVASAHIRLAGRFSMLAEVRFGATFHGLTASSDGRDAGGVAGVCGGARWGVAYEP